MTGLEVLAEAAPLPFSVEDEHTQAGEELRLTYRYLDLRRAPRLQALELRGRVVRAIRDVLEGEGFLEVETPMLTRSTPEGARDFLVPSRLQQGSFYALPQSPQLFKQLLMVGGIERYYQIVRCFRDEDLRADRQPEFTQVDIEASFVEPADIQALVEQVLVAAWAQAGIALEAPFPRMGYHEAMRRFGTDRPDLRFACEIADWSQAAATSGLGVFGRVVGAGGVVRAIVFPGAGAGLSRKDLDGLVVEAQELGAKGLVWAVPGAGGGAAGLGQGRVPRGARRGARRGCGRPDRDGRRHRARRPARARRTAHALGRAVRPHSGGRLGAAVGHRFPAGRMERRRAALGRAASSVHGPATRRMKIAYNRILARCSPRPTTS